MAAAAVRVLARLRERGQVRHILLWEHAAPAAIREEGHEHPAMPMAVSASAMGKEDGGWGATHSAQLAEHLLMRVLPTGVFYLREHRALCLMSTMALTLL